jgi:acyl carrier protein
MSTKFLSLVADIAKVPVHQIHADSSFRDDLGIDSLQFVNLLVQVTVEFNIELNAIQSMGDLETVGDMYSKLILKR